MTWFFNVLGDIISFLSSWTIFGNISMWSILLLLLFIPILAKLIKGREK